MNSQLILIAVVIIVVLLVVFAAFSFLKKPAKTKKPKPRALAEAEQAFAANQFTFAVIKAFGALEIALKETYGKGSAENSFEFIKTAVSKGRFGKSEENMAHQLRMLRNKVVHDQLNLGRNEASDALNSARHLIKMLNYSVE